VVLILARRSVDAGQIVVGESDIELQLKVMYWAWFKNARFRVALG
jgi:hypothetical protein